MTILNPLLWMLVVAVSGIPPLAATSATDFSNYRWKHRLLLIFAPSATDATFLALDKHLARTALEIEDRDMITFRIFENNSSLFVDEPLESADAEATRRRFVSHRANLQWCWWAKTAASSGLHIETLIFNPSSI